MRDVLVVSAGERCFWLLDQLCETDLKVSVWDVSSDLALSLPEREGPFGVFLPDNLDNLKKKYLCGDQFEIMPKGFCVLSPQGPIEFRGPLTSFLIRKNQELNSCYSCLTEHSTHRKFTGLKTKRETNWLYNLAFQWAGVYQDSDRLSPLPLFSECVLRESSFRYLQEINHSFQEKGVSYISEKLEGISFKNDHISLAFQNAKVKTRLLVWALSGLETKIYFGKGMDILFPHWKQPKRIWKRYSLLWDKADFQKNYSSWSYSSL